MGFKTSVVAQAVIDMLSLPMTIEEFEEEIVKLYQELFPSAILLPGDKYKFKSILGILFNRSFFMFNI